MPALATANDNEQPRLGRTAGGMQGEQTGKDDFF